MNRAVGLTLTCNISGCTWVNYRMQQFICLMPWNTAFYSCCILCNWSQAMWRKCPDLVEKNVLLMTHLHSRKLSHTGMKKTLLIRHAIVTAVNILTWGWRGSLSFTVMTHVHIHGGEHFTWWLTQHCGMLTERYCHSFPVLMRYLYVTYFLGHWICISGNVSNMNILHGD